MERDDGDERPRIASAPASVSYRATLLPRRHDRRLGQGLAGGRDAYPRRACARFPARPHRGTDARGGQAMNAAVHDSRSEVLWRNAYDALASAVAGFAA